MIKNEVNNFGNEETQATKMFRLCKEYELLKSRIEEVRTELDSVLDNLGEDTYHQDPETMSVYKVVKPKGTFTYYRDLDYHRTAFEGEVKGSLSKKEAEQLGFYLKK